MIPPMTRTNGLNWPQCLVIGMLILFSSNVLSLVPFSIGPITVTMLVELGVVVALLGPLMVGLRSLDRRAKLFIFVCLCMFVLSLIHLDGIRLVYRIKYIFGSVYVYVLITCIFRGPGAMPWVRRLHLIPAYAMLTAFSWALFTQLLFDVRERVGGNDLPTYLAVLLPICWTQCRNEVGAWRVLNGVVVLAAFGVEVLSASRGAAVCLAFASILVFFTDKRSKSKWLPLVIALSLLVGVRAYEEMAITQRVTEMIAAPKKSLQERLMLWKAATLFTSDHPLLGGDFRGNVGEYVSRVTWGSDAPMRIQRGELSTASGEHNGYLAATAGYGIVVGAFYIAYFLGLGRRLLRALRTMPDEHSRVYLMAGLSTLLVWSVGMIGSHIFLGWHYLLIWGALECALAAGPYGRAAWHMSPDAWMRSRRSAVSGRRSAAPSPTPGVSVNAYYIGLRNGGPDVPTSAPDF